MKVKILTLAAVLATILIQPIRAIPNSVNIRAAESAAGGRAGQSGGFESVVPREGLQFYLEITSAGLGELVRGGNATMVSKMLAAGPMKMTTTALAAFVTGNAGVISNAKLAIVSYGSGGAVAVIEAANVPAAEQLSASAARLLASNRPSQRVAASDVDVVVRGQIVFAGGRAAVARLAEASGKRTLADDQEFMKARARFSEDQIFAFVELGSTGLWSPGAAGGAMDVAQTAGMLAAMGGMPYAIALGGSFEGDAANVRALLLNGSKPGSGGVLSNLLGGLFSSSKSSANFGEPMAASFAGPNVDVFVDLMIDWDKLLDAIQSMFGMFAGAVAAGANDPQLNGGAQSADFLAMAEASLGFSFKHDLIPTLGNELAITLSGFNTTRETLAGPIATLPGQMTNAVVKKSSPQFMLLVAVRDEAKFEKLLGKLLNGPMGAGARQVARTPYRGATISSSKDFAYAITGGFLLAGGSVAEIRRAIDAHAVGSSLAATPEFRQAMRGSGQATLQAYLSSRLSKEMFDSLSKEMAKSGGRAEEAAATSQTASAIGLSIIPDDEGLMINAHVPTNLALLALGSLLSAKPPAVGISSAPAGPDSAPRRSGERATPKLTDDDLRLRRP